MTQVTWIHLLFMDGLHGHILWILPKKSTIKRKLHNPGHILGYGRNIKSTPHANVHTLGGIDSKMVKILAEFRAADTTLNTNNTNLNREDGISVGEHVVPSGGHLKNAYRLLNLRALNFHLRIKSTSFNVWARYFVWNFKGYLWNSTQNILPIHWKLQFLYNIEILRAPPPPPTHSPTQEVEG